MSIIFRTDNPPAPKCAGVVRIAPAAERIVKAVTERTGLSAREVVSEIIIQSADSIMVVGKRAAKEAPTEDPKAALHTWSIEELVEELFRRAPM